MTERHGIEMDYCPTCSPDSPDGYHYRGQQQYGDPRQRRRRKSSSLDDLIDF